MVALVVLFDPLKSSTDCSNLEFVSFLCAFLMNLVQYNLRSIQNTSCEFQNTSFCHFSPTKPYEIPQYQTKYPVQACCPLTIFLAVRLVPVNRASPTTCAYRLVNGKCTEFYHFLESVDKKYTKTQKAPFSFSINFNLTLKILLQNISFYAINNQCKKCFSFSQQNMRK